MYLSNAVTCMHHVLCVRTVRWILCPCKDIFSHFKAFCSDVLVTLYMLAGSGLELITPVAEGHNSQQQNVS